MSGLGKGITISSIGRILKSSGLRVTSIKIDPYLNVDAGTMSPFEHGEAFVLDDGGETDLDLGNYERFANVLSLLKVTIDACNSLLSPPFTDSWTLLLLRSITLRLERFTRRYVLSIIIRTACSFQSSIVFFLPLILSYLLSHLQVISQERRGDYLGKTVQMVPHATDMVQKWIEDVASIPVDGTGAVPDVCLVEVNVLYDVFFVFW